MKKLNAFLVLCLLVISGCGLPYYRETTFSSPTGSLTTRACYGADGQPFDCRIAAARMPVAVSPATDLGEYVAYLDDCPMTFSAFNTRRIKNSTGGLGVGLSVNGHEVPLTSAGLPLPVIAPGQSVCLIIPAADQYQPIEMEVWDYRKDSMKRYVPVYRGQPVNLEYVGSNGRPLDLQDYRGQVARLARYFSNGIPVPIGDGPQFIVCDRELFGSDPDGTRVELHRYHERTPAMYCTGGS
jgi:hypothetical protein